MYFQLEVLINPLFAENALTDFDQGTLDDLIEQPGKWQEFGAFYLKFMKWDKLFCCRPLYAKGYGGWLSIKNLPLDYWNNQTFEVMGAYFGDLVDISRGTLNFLNVSEAKIQVKENLCGSILATIEINDKKRGNFFLNFVMFLLWIHLA